MSSDKQSVLTFDFTSVLPQDLEGEIRDWENNSTKIKGVVVRRL
ncbi:hypothetical protein [Chroococcidiopsis sp. CCNUC1]|nr:hypothetical protein [Chroococcidiopsis sp. CCNUC1]